MKVAVLVVFICLIPVLIRAFELGELAKKERARRQKLASSQDVQPSRSFDDADLEIYHRPGRPAPLRSSRRPPVIPSRDLVEERAFWRKEKGHHQRELARLDAQIRRLKWRLAERESRRRPGERLRRDPTEHVLEESIESLRQDRMRLVQDFQERARKAGALPGWLR